MRSATTLCWTVTLWVAILSIPPAGWSADLMTFSNAGFEQPGLSAGNSWYGGVVGWQYSGGIGTTYATAALPASPAPEGQQYLWGNAAGVMVFQTVGTIAADTLYTFEVDLFRIDESTTTAQIWIEQDGGAFTVFDDLYFRPSWNTSQEDFDFPTGAWTTVTLRFGSAQHPGLVGQPLRIRVAGDYLAIDNARVYVSGLRPARDFVISSSEGDDSNDGLTQQTPWQGFSQFQRELLQPGDRVLIKRGDVWNEEVFLYGSGSASDNILLSGYGTGPRPIIERTDIQHDRCVVIQNASHWLIRDLHCRHAKLGLYLRYMDSYNNTNVTVEDCLFEDMDDWMAGAELYGHEYAFNAGIFVGGNVVDQYATVLSNLTVQHCGFLNCTAGFITNWYFPEAIKDRLTNVLIQNCYGTRTSAGAICLNSMANSTVRDFRIFEPCGKDGDFVWGSTGGIIWSCQDLVLEDCEFAETDRMWHDDQAGDGSGLDLDGMNQTVTLRDCVYHNNESVGQLFLSTLGSNQNMRIEDSTFYNNGLDAAVSFNGNAYAIKASPGTNLNGVLSNIGMYRSAPSWGWIYPDPPPNFTLTNPRYGWYADVSGRPATWGFESDGDLEGWSGFSSDWQTPTVVGGELTGTCGAGGDPFGQSPATWINTFRYETLHVRMRSNGGTTGQVFFITETDPVWDGNKTLAFPVITDGQLHDYVLDMEDSGAWSGVVTQLRIDPTVQVGAEFGIDSVTVKTAPWVKAAAVVSATQLDITFNEPLREGAHDCANYRVWGSARGTAALHPDSVTLLTGSTYRLEWETGDLQPAGTVRVTLGTAIKDRYLNAAEYDPGSAPEFNSDPLLAADALEEAAYVATIAGSAVDPDQGDAITYQKLSGPEWLVVSADGGLSGTPPLGQSGENVFMVQARDTADQTDTAELRINVLAAATPTPTATATPLPTDTATLVPTDTATATPTQTSIPTLSPTATESATPTATESSTPTVTSTATEVVLPTPTEQQSGVNGSYWLYR